jgi:PAS domain S-box-containing protein
MCRVSTFADESSRKPRFSSWENPMAAPEAWLSRVSNYKTSNDIFRLLVDSVRDYAIFVLSPDGNVLTWNPGAQALKGYSKEEIIGHHFSKFYLPEAVQSGWPTRELAMAEKEGRFADEGWRVRKDGSSFWASVIITALRDSTGKLSGFAKITQDMTERRDAAERINNLNRELRKKITELDESRRIIELRTLELQKLSSVVLHAQDEERRRIARELHDDLGQQLSLLKMVLSQGKNDEAGEIAGSALTSVRNLSYLLHPPLLDETGLRAALDWFIEGLSKRSGIEIALTIRPQIFPRLRGEIETAIFRVIQEALTNVVRHAKTESARVEIDKQPEIVVVRVRDYGQGLPVEVDGALSPKSMGVGISGMRERIRQFGGELRVSRSEPGTMVEAKIPLFT